MDIQINELHGIDIRDKRLFTWLWMMEVFDLMKGDPISQSWQKPKKNSFKW
jgi:hypothetical protein